VIQVKPDGLGQDRLLQVAPLQVRIARVVAMGQASDTLDGDRPVIEDRSSVKRGGSDQLDPSAMGLVTGSPAGKARKEGCVGIDDRTRSGPTEGRLAFPDGALLFS
jgi:hypothetical protein